jgi:uncharacterized membrane protein YidH (DUF202 family)
MIERSVDGSGSAQAERTVLSWNRLALAVTANGALLARAGFVHDLVLVNALGLAVASVGFALWLISLTRYSTLAGQSPSHLFGRKALPALATFVVVLSLIDLAVVVFTG